MPTYVYRCDSCGHQFELFQRMSDDPVDTCPECERKVRRVIHPVGVVFKGSGWYINDSRSKGSTDAPAASDTRSETAAEKKADKPAESKPKPEPVKAAAD
jgi:putative FmdB family regulatory protein